MLPTAAMVLVQYDTGPISPQSPRPRPVRPVREPTDLLAKPLVQGKLKTAPLPAVNARRQRATRALFLHQVLHRSPKYGVTHPSRPGTPGHINHPPGYHLHRWFPMGQKGCQKQPVAARVLTNLEFKFPGSWSFELADHPPVSSFPDSCSTSCLLSSQFPSSRSFPSCIAIPGT
jgi:hypothetical protein